MLFMFKTKLVVHKDDMEATHDKQSLRVGKTRRPHHDTTCVAENAPPVVASMLAIIPTPDPTSLMASTREHMLTNVLARTS